MLQDRKIAVIGLGYVGLPVAAAFKRKGADVVGFDISAIRISELNLGIDRTNEIGADELRECGDIFTDDPDRLAAADFYIVTVPTPIDQARRPNLGPLIAASTTISRYLSKGDIVVYESTVYPGATRDDCVPVLEKGSGLRCGADFTVGYSPERINPGDKEHTFQKIRKVVSGWDAHTLDIVADVYASVVEAGVYKAQSIETAEAAKVIENTQRDLNIAFVNELSTIFHRMGLDTNDVLDAASTKWNFLRFRPGLVGGHCIGVDPYYLTERAQIFGCHPEVILAGRRINDSMGEVVAERCIKAMSRRSLSSRPVTTILGMSFKENVPDTRNTRVIDIVRILTDYGVEVQAVDPVVSPDEVMHEYGLALTPVAACRPADCVVLAVPHKEFLAAGWQGVQKLLRSDGGVCFDVKGALDRANVPGNVELLRL